MASVEEVLAHYGVPGMKWGKRKSGAKASGSTTSTTKFSKSPSRLSDEELTKRIKRLDMEKRYNELNAAKQSEGKKIANRVMRNVTEQTATKVLNQVAYYTVKTAISKQIGANTAAGIFGGSQQKQKKKKKKTP